MATFLQFGPACWGLISFRDMTDSKPLLIQVMIFKCFIVKWVAGTRLDKIKHQDGSLTNHHQSDMPY